MVTPRVSVIMPARNEESRVGLAVASVLNQTLSAWQLIVVDDASTDQTLRVLQAFAAADPRVEVFSSPRNLGRAGARNLAIERSEADLIAVLDADDIMMPERLRRQADYMACHPDVGMLGGGAYFVVPGCSVPRRVQPSTDDGAIRRQLSQGIMPFVHSSVVFRRELLLSHGGYVAVTPFYNEDYHLCVQLIETTRAAALTEPMVIMSCDGLLQQDKLRAKYREMIDLQRILMRERFSWRRYLNLVLRQLPLSWMPSSLAVRLMQHRLERLPSCSSRERDTLAGWVSLLALYRDEVQQSHR